MKELLAVAVCAWSWPAAAHEPGALDALKAMAASEANVPVAVKVVEVRAMIPAELLRILYVPPNRPLPVFPDRRCPDSLCTGDEVATVTGYAGVVAGLFPDGRVSVHLRGYDTQNYTYSRNDLAVTHGCNAQSCVGDPVTVADNRAGKLVGIFPDGRLSVRVSGYERFGTYVPGSVAGVRRCSAGLCADSRIATLTGYAGVVVGVFEGGGVAVRFDGYDSLYTYTRAQLAEVEGCSQGICVGASVITEAGQSSRVMGIFQDGRFAVKVPGYDRFGVYSRGQLAVPGCS